jgi:hypothetical protein
MPARIRTTDRHADLSREVPNVRPITPEILPSMPLRA